MFYVNRRALRRLGAAIMIIGVPALSACSGPSPTLSALPSQASLPRPAAHRAYLEFTYRTLNDPEDATTEILGINNLAKICGFYGTPNTGFSARTPYEHFQKLDYPSAADTVITAVNNDGLTAGWYKDSKGRIFGLTYAKGIWQSYQDPKLLLTGKAYTELLGLEDGGLAVGFYQDKSNVDHAFEMNTLTAQFHAISPPDAIASAATGINGKGDVVGWLTLSNGTTQSWLLKGGQFTEFAYPKATVTEATSVNWADDIVGFFEGRGGEKHGFLLTNPLTSQSWQEVDEPLADGLTVVTGINNHHVMVGYYKDAKKDIDGFTATETTAGIK